MTTRTVIGTNNADLINIGDANPVPGINVSGAAGGSNGNTVDSELVVQAGGGSDLIDLADLTSASGVTAVTVFGGDGTDLIQGGQLGEMIDGQGGSDAIDAGAGNDSIVGGGSNDSIIGGDGIDTAYYAGNRASFSITNSQIPGASVISDSAPLQAGDEGSDTLFGVEVVRFADETLVLATNTVVVLDADGAIKSSFSSIQAAVNASASGDTVLVGRGTYFENVLINTSGITLLSSFGSEETKIVGTAGTALGTIQLAPGLSDVQIGDLGRGFEVVGINGNGAVVNAAVYLQGDQSGHAIVGNKIVANGDSALLSEFAGDLDNILIEGNEFAGQTFEGLNPSGEGFDTQDDLGNNAPRQLVVLGNGTEETDSGVVFRDNLVSGTAGGVNTLGAAQGNTLVTIDAVNSEVSDNTFTGFTDRFGVALRVRGEGTDVINNTLDQTTGGASRGILVQNANANSVFTGNVLVAGDQNSLITSFTPGEDSLAGGAGNDTLISSGGNDTLFGRGGADQLVGQQGADRFVFTQGDSSSTAAFDTVTDFASGSDKIVLASSVVFGGNIAFGSQSELIAGANAFNGVNYGVANAVFSLSTPTDTFVYSDANGDGIVNLGSGDLFVKLSGNVGPITASDFVRIIDDNLVGTAAADTLDGGAGNDTLTGAQGVDLLIGGTGADIFVFNQGDSGSTQTFDRITDFVRGTDKVALTSSFQYGGNIGFGSEAELISLANSVNGADLGAANLLISLSTPTDTFFYSDANGDGIVNLGAGDLFVKLVGVAGPVDGTDFFAPEVISMPT